MRSGSGNLLILSCSKTKNKDLKSGPALEIYDGVNFRVLRKFLREKGWPPGLEIKIISAKYGIINATAVIKSYDLILTAERAAALNGKVLSVLKGSGRPRSVFINLGTDYLRAIEGYEDIFPQSRVSIAKGGIGKKMHAMKAWLEGLPRGTAKVKGREVGKKPYLYFFPYWDDYVYEPFLGGGEKGGKAGANRRKVHPHEYFGKGIPFDGVLLSLSNIYARKGPLHRLYRKEAGRVDMREELNIPKGVLLFGDCGAFSYSAEKSPPFSPVQAAEIYEKFGFDIGASVDHIPLREVFVRERRGPRVKKELSLSTRYRRVRKTVDNAAEFLKVCRRKGYSFTPLGVIQGIGVRSYVSNLHEYLDMGYEHVALGGLVPRSDNEIVEIVCAVREAIQQRTRGLKMNVWVHLFGILRPKLQPFFVDIGVSSFDSASYFRKSWLRSDQNYLAPGGEWYAAIRIPFSNSKTMRETAEKNGITFEDLQELEEKSLAAIQGFDAKTKSVRSVLSTVEEYGSLLERISEDNHFHEKYKKLLTERPWEKCNCPVCRELGLEVVVFRGAERNKRRGFHNTWIFYHGIMKKLIGFK